MDIYKLQSIKNYQQYIVELSKLLQIKDSVKRIEVFDNSHCFGSYAIGAIVVCGIDGFQKSLYRRYNITNTKSPDDYSMLYEVLTRRFVKDKKQDLPELMIIDGGKGHLKVALRFLACNFITDITVIAVAKGKNRNSDNEIVYTKNNKMIMLDKTSKLKQYIQLLRDEAHRFAISGYRRKALLSIDNSILDNIPGIGGIRKKKLLTFFGSVKNLQAASLIEIEKVPGINSRMSKLIYEYINKEL